MAPPGIGSALSSGVRVICWPTSLSKGREASQGRLHPGFSSDPAWGSGSNRCAYHTPRLVFFNSTLDTKGEPEGIMGGLNPPLPCQGRASQEGFPGSLNT